MLSSVLQQGIFLMGFCFLPYIALTVMGHQKAFHMLQDLDFMGLVKITMGTQLHLSLRAAGVVSTAGAILYYKLPYGIIPGFIPLLSGIDRLISIIVGIFGLCLLLLSYQLG